MDGMNRKRDTTRLGRLLVEKQLISEAQLEAAIRAQGQGGRRLGEILADMQLITHAQVRGAIRRQRKLRLAAALATALLGPLHAYAAAASAPEAVWASAREFGARPLSEEELGAVTARRRPDDDAAAPPADEAMTNALREQARQAALRLQWLEVISARAAQAASEAAALHGMANGGVKVLGDLSGVLNPLTMLLSADISVSQVSQVSFSAENAVASIGKDGAVTLKVPSSIGEISFHNLRVGSQPGPALGSDAIRDIDLRAATVTIKPR